MTLKELQDQSRWLLQYASNVTSQCGEEVSSRRRWNCFPKRNGWCIEFGTWDGRFASNTYNLINTSGYRGVLIESEPSRFRDLEKTHDPKETF